MAIKVISGNTKLKQITVGTPVRIVRRIKASEFEFGSLQGIDITGVTDGAMLVYNDGTENFEAKVEITNTNTTFNGGNF
jgi:hypothetical protein